MTLFNIDTLKTKHYPTISFWSKNSVQLSKLASILIGVENKISFFIDEENLLFLKIDNDKGFPLMPMERSYNHRVNSRDLITKIRAFSNSKNPKFVLNETEDKTVFQLKIINK